MMDLEHLRPPLHTMELHLTHEEMQTLILLIAEDEKLCNDTIPLDGSLFILNLNNVDEIVPTLAWYAKTESFPIRFWEKRNDFFISNGTNIFHKFILDSWQKIKE